jgi:hypothetical protein
VLVLPLHVWRRTSALQQMVHGGDVISLPRKLGHSGSEMTKRCVHLASDQLAAIRQRVSPVDKLDVKPMRVPKSK